MAKYNIKWSCGHTETKDLFGKEDGRVSYIAWARNFGVCTACRAANAAAHIEAIEQEHALAPLQGSDKQIAWARKIRFEKIVALTAELDRVAAKVPSDKLEVFNGQRDAAMTALASKAESKFWIDNREVSGQPLVLKAVRG